jgi:hypothetical protein
VLGAIFKHTPQLSQSIRPLLLWKQLILAEGHAPNLTNVLALKIADLVRPWIAIIHVAWATEGADWLQTQRLPANLVCATRHDFLKARNLGSGKFLLPGNREQPRVYVFKWGTLERWKIAKDATSLTMQNKWTIGHITQQRDGKTSVAMLAIGLNKSYLVRRTHAPNNQLPGKNS